MLVHNRFEKKCLKSDVKWKTNKCFHKMIKSKNDWINEQKNRTLWRQENECNAIHDRWFKYYPNCKAKITNRWPIIKHTKLPIKIKKTNSQDEFKTKARFLTVDFYLREQISMLHKWSFEHLWKNVFL